MTQKKHFEERFHWFPVHEKPIGVENIWGVQLKNIYIVLIFSFLQRRLFIVSFILVFTFISWILRLSQDLHIYDTSKTPDGNA